MAQLPRASKSVVSDKVRAHLHGQGLMISQLPSVQGRSSGNMCGLISFPIRSLTGKEPNDSIWLMKSSRSAGKLPEINVSGSMMANSKFDVVASSSNFDSWKYFLRHRQKKTSIGRYSHPH